MQFAKVAENILRTDLDGAAAAGMKPGRATGHDLQGLHRRAGRGENCKCVAFRIEGVDRPGLARPMPADAVGFGERAAHAAGRGELVFRTVAFKDLPDLEQRGIGETAVGIALRRHDQAGKETWPHVGQFGGDRISQRQCRAAATEKLGLSFRHE